MKPYLAIDQMPNEIGKANPEFVPYKTQIHNFVRGIHYYASVIGVFVSLVSLIVAVA